MSRFDTLLNVDQSIRLKGLGKLSEAQLQVALESNKQLVSLKKQLGNEMRELQRAMESQNQIQQRQLENQIREIEFKEIQKFHKERIVRCKEFLSDYGSITDPYVQYLFIRDLINKIEDLIDESRQVLSEIPDKEYCVNLKKQLINIKSDFKNEINLIEIETLFEFSTKLLQLENENENKIYEEELALKAYEDIIEKDKLRTHVFTKNQEDEVTQFKGGIGCLGILSIISVLFIWGIIIQLSTGLRPLNSKTVYIGLPVLILLILSFVYSIIKYRRFKKIPKTQYESALDEETKQSKEKYMIVKEQVKAIKDDIMRIRSNYKSTYSDMIYEHPEFLKVDYLLEDYQL